MQRVEIDCQTKQVTIVELSPDEVDAVTVERQQNEQRELIEQRKANKQQIIGKLVELREMKQNRDIFDEGDIAGLQAEIDELKSRLL
jgi:hypothetical protein